MKRILTILLLTLCVATQAQDIVKTGYNLGPLPAVAFDADKGFQYGALLNIYNYGDGTNYPNYNSKTYLEASFFTKGSQLFVLSYDNKTLIPGVRWSSTIRATLDKALDFYGFNGYGSWFDHQRIAIGNANKINHNSFDYQYTPYYRSARDAILVKTDFIGKISNHLSWAAGYNFLYTKQGPIDRASINKGKPDYNIYPDSASTLFEDYIKWGIISPEEANGGIMSSIRLGLVYDSRDKEGAPSRGIWASAHLAYAPSWLGSTQSFARYVVTMRQYLPLIDNDVLTLAYRLNYEGTLSENAPYYVLPYISAMGEDFDRDGMGGYRTVRGMMRNRVVGLDTATATVELRWRFINFVLANQNIAFALSAFSDNTMVTRGRDLSFKGEESARASYNAYMANCRPNDSLHSSVGAGLRFIMNQNFIVAFEYGTPISHFLPKSPLYNQDGTGAFYINTGYLF